MILWGNKRFQEALDETDECLRKAPQLCAAEVYRTLALVGLGRIVEAKTQLSNISHAVQALQYLRNFWSSPAAS
jgi:hypothetical protein